MEKSSKAYEKLEKTCLINGTLKGDTLEHCVLQSAGMYYYIVEIGQ
jgi:hypothetical protein